jgi:hypothetical protein
MKRRSTSTSRSSGRSTVPQRTRSSSYVEIRLLRALPLTRLTTFVGPCSGSVRSRRRRARARSFQYVQRSFLSFKCGDTEPATLLLGPHYLDRQHRALCARPHDPRVDQVRAAAGRVQQPGLPSAGREPPTSSQLSVRRSSGDTCTYKANDRGAPFAGLRESTL